MNTVSLGTRAAISFFALVEGMYKPTNQPNCIKFICVFALTFRERCVVAVNAPGNSKGIVNIFLLAPAGAVKISKY